MYKIYSPKKTSIWCFLTEHCDGNGGWGAELCPVSHKIQAFKKTNASKSKYIGTIHNPDILTNTSVSAHVIKLIISASFLQSQSPLWHLPLGSIKP